MDQIGSLLFLSSVTENIKTHCQRLVESESWISVTGHINVTFGSGEIVGYVLDEKISKTAQDEFRTVSSSSPLVSTETSGIYEVGKSNAWYGRMPNGQPTRAGNNHNNENQTTITSTSISPRQSYSNTEGNTLSLISSKLES